MELEQKGIKWWKQCASCGWEGRAMKVDNDNVTCPNCDNPELTEWIDKRVFNGRRHDHDVQNRHENAAADKARQDAGRQPAPPDTVSISRPGYQYGTGPNDFKKPVWN